MSKATTRSIPLAHMRDLSETIHLEFRCVECGELVIISDSDEVEHCECGLTYRAQVHIEIGEQKGYGRER